MLFFFKKNKNMENNKKKKKCEKKVNISNKYNIIFDN